MRVGGVCWEGRRVGWGRDVGWVGHSGGVEEEYWRCKRVEVCCGVDRNMEGNH